MATREEIAQRHQQWEIIGSVQVRDVDPASRYFTPHRAPVGNLRSVIALASSSRHVAIAGVAS